MLAVQADGAEIETVEGLADGRRADPLQKAFHEHHGLQCGYCTPGILMAATDSAAPTTRIRATPEIRRAIRGNICRCTGYVNIVDSIRGGRRRRRRGGIAMSSTPVSETTVERVEQSERLGRWSGTSMPRKEDRRLLQGQGTFVDDGGHIHMGYAHFVRSPYAHARILSVDIARAEALAGVYATLTGTEVRELTQPFFQIAPEPGGQDRRVLPGRRTRSATRASRSPSCSPTPAEPRATPPSSSRSSTSRCRRSSTRSPRPRQTRRSSTTRSAATSSGTASTTTATSTGHCRRPTTSSGSTGCTSTASPRRRSSATRPS